MRENVICPTIVLVNFLLSMPLIASEPASSEPRIVDLPTVLRLARARSLDIKIAAEQVNEAKANRDSAVWGFFPWIEPGAAYKRHEGRIQAVDGTMFDVNKQLYDIGGTVNAQVDIGDATYKALAAKQLFKAASEGLEAQRQDSTVNAAEAYFELVKAQGIVGTLEEGVRISQDYQKQVHEAVQAGIAFKGDELRVQTQTERTQVSLRQAREQQRVAAAHLAETLHLDASLELAAEDKGVNALSVMKTEHSLDVLVQQALRSRPELRQAHDSVLAAKEAKNGTVYGPLIPFVDAQVFAGGLGGGQGNSTGNFGSSADYDVGIGWRVGPGGLFDVGKMNAGKARLYIQQLAYEKVKDRIITEVVEAHTRMQSLSDQIQATRENLDTATETLRLTTERKQFGIGAVLEDIQAQQEVTRARADYLTAITDFDKAQYALMRATGAGVEDDKAFGNR